MQLDRPEATKPPTLLRERLSRAALALLLVPAAAAADADTPSQVDVTTLYYGEQNRTAVYEPIVRATRLFANGQSLSAQLGLDVITGASPTGALPAGTVQTRTSASGRVTTIGAGEIPTTRFEDRRFAFDSEWKLPLGRLFSLALDGHASREKDYQSLGLSATVAAELLQKTLTVTAGGGVNRDRVDPVGGTPIGLTDGSLLADRTNDKRVTSLLFGVSRILSRRWMMSVDASRTTESGYLTEPYKVVSVMDPQTGMPLRELTDERPSTRARSAVLVSSVYHLTDDILYASYRYYWDSWSVRSQTLDVKYRRDLGDDWYLEPHVRYYQQSAAKFFTIGLVDGPALPDFATADYRLGALRTLTAGTSFVFHLFDSPAEWTVRAEYIRQAGDSSPPNAIGVQRRFDLAPTINIFTVVVGYSFRF